MKMQVNGTVTKLSAPQERTSKQGKTFYSFYVGVNGTDYSFMSNGQQLMATNHTPVSEGSEVIFTATQNGQYLNGDSKTLFVQGGVVGHIPAPVVAPPVMTQAPIVQAPAVVKASGVSKDIIICTQSQIQRCVEILIAAKDTDPAVKNDLDEYNRTHDVKIGFLSENNKIYDLK